MNMFKNTNPTLKKQTTRGHNKGFTLIELLVVVAIIGVLATLVITALGNARERARDARRHSDINTIQNALEIYYLDHGEYPTIEGATYPNSNWVNSSDASWEALETEMGVDLPEDPVNEDGGWAGGSGQYLNYAYYSNNTGSYGCSAGQSYWLVYTLEQGVDLSERGGVKRCSDGELQFWSNSITVGFSPAN